MNINLIESMGRIAPPIYPPTTITNTFAVNESGEIFMLSQDGKLKYSSIDSTSDADDANNNDWIDLIIDGIDIDDLLDFTNIICQPTAISNGSDVVRNIKKNEWGSYIILWSPTKIGMIYLHTAVSQANNRCNFTPLYDISNNAIRNNGGFATDDELNLSVIKQVSFHIYNPLFIVILHEKEFLVLYDLINNDFQNIVLPTIAKNTNFSENNNFSTELLFSSFVFGSQSIDIWSKFSIFILTMNGDVYILCPIIPTGTVISQTHVNELWDWVNNLHDNTSNTISLQYSEIVKSYLTECVSLSTLFNANNNQYIDNKLENDKAYIRSGEMQFKSLLEYNYNYVKSNHIPLLQGPLKIERNVKSVNSNDNHSNQRIGNDICFPIVHNINSSVPVLIVSYNSGEIEYLLLAGNESSFSKSLVGPSWRCLDRVGLQLMYPPPSLTLADQINALDAKQIEITNGIDFYWKLTPDPVVSHFIHVSNITKAESMLISSSWLRRSLEELEEILSKHNNYNDNNTLNLLKEAHAIETKEMDHNSLVSDVIKNDSVEIRPLIIPLLINNSSTTSAVWEEQKINNNSKSIKNNESYDFEENLVGLSGMSIIHDPFIGHIVIYRNNDGMTSAVNLSVHTKLFQLQSIIAKHDNMEHIQTLKDELNKLTDQGSVRWKKAQQLIKQIAEGLQIMPRVETSDKPEEPNSLNNKYLIEASYLLEKNVIMPIKELAKMNQFNFEMLQDIATTQKNIIEGISNNTTNHLQSNNNSNVKEIGLKGVISNITREQETLNNRIEAIKSKFDLLKESAETQVNRVMNKHSHQLSQAEKQYKKQLEEWSRVTGSMNQSIEQLERATKPVPIVPIYNQSPMTRSTNNSYNSSRLFSPTFTGVIGSPGVLPPTRSLTEQLNQNTLSLSRMNVSNDNLFTPTKMNNYTQSSIISSGKTLNRSIQSQSQSHMVSANNKITLTATEIQTCMELLTAQSDMIKESEESILLLQEKLKYLKQSSNLNSK
eukprot:gene7059-9635_t